MKGKLIVFEGLDGSGKSTQVKLLQEHLDTLGVESIALRSPGGNPLCESIREVALSEDMGDEITAMLMLASHLALYKMEVRSHLAEGKVVILDRYLDSLRAYQGSTPELYEMIETIISVTSLPKADYTIYLDIDPRLSISRKVKDPNINYFDKMTIPARESILERYWNIYDSPSETHTVIKAELPIDTIATQIRQVLLS